MDKHHDRSDHPSPLPGKGTRNRCFSVYRAMPSVTMVAFRWSTNNPYADRRVRRTTVQAINRTIPPTRELCFPTWSNLTLCRLLARQLACLVELTESIGRLWRSSGTAVELEHPGRGYEHLGNTRAVFERHYLDIDQVAFDRPLPRLSRKGCRMNTQQLIDRISRWPIPAGEWPAIIQQLTDCRTGDDYSPGRRRCWLMYRVACVLLSGSQMDADADDFELGSVVAEGEARMAAGDVGRRELSEAFHRAMMGRWCTVSRTFDDGY